MNTRFCNFSSDWRHELSKCYITIQKNIYSFLMSNYLFKKLPVFSNALRQKQFQLRQLYSNKYHFELNELWQHLAQITAKIWSGLRRIETRANRKTAAGGCTRPTFQEQSLYGQLQWTNESMTTAFIQNSSQAIRKQPAPSSFIQLLGPFNESWNNFLLQGDFWVRKTFDWKVD